MIKAIDTAALGMLNAQKRATELAGDILKTTSGTQQGTEYGSSDAESTAFNPSGGSPTTAEKGIQPFATGQTNSLIQQISYFKLAELQFRASATAFKRIADSSEDLLGLLLDKKS